MCELCMAPGAGTNNWVFLLYWVSLFKNAQLLGIYTVFSSTPHVNSAKLHQECERMCMCSWEKKWTSIWIHSSIINKLLIKAKRFNIDSYVIYEHVNWLDSLCRHSRWSILEKSLGARRQSSTPNMSYGDLTYCILHSALIYSRSQGFVVRDYDKPQRQPLKHQWT